MVYLGRGKQLFCKVMMSCTTLFSLMAEEQNKLSNKIQALTPEFSSHNWKTVVATTDLADPCIRAVVIKGQETIETAFSSEYLSRAVGATSIVIGNGSPPLSVRSEDVITDPFAGVIK